MTSNAWPSGVLTALVTPLTDDAVDVEVLGRLVEHHITEGVSGLVVAGGTGEFGALSLDERRSIAQASVLAASGRVPVVVQTGALTTRDALTLGEHAEQIGADAIMIASPFGESISWPERLRFYEVVTAAVSLPMMIYNTPPSGLLTLEQIQQLAALPNVGAVKDSSGSAELMGDLLEWVDGGDFAVYVGVDSLFYDAVRAGARGAIFGTANLVPGPLSALAQGLRSCGATRESDALWRQLRPFLRFMERSSNYVGMCKAGLALQRFEVGSTRSPYLMPDEREVEDLAEWLDTVERVFADHVPG